MTATSPALATATAPIYIGIGVFLVEGMAVFAMGFCGLTSTISRATYRKAVRIDAPFWAYDGTIRQPGYRAGNDSIGFKARCFGQIGRAVIAAFNSYPFRYSPISLGLLSAGPLAVFRRIVAIVVNAVKNIAGRPLPHVRRPSFIALPAGAYFNAAPSVIHPLVKSRVAASLNHRTPNLIVRRLNFKWHWPVSRMVRKIVVRCSLKVKGGCYAL